MKAGCAIWLGKTNGPAGYGYVRSGARRVLVHRLSWEREHGPIPPGLCVLHECDNPPCFNTGHLFLGTMRANSLNMLSKGRDWQGRKGFCPNGHAYDLVLARSPGSRRIGTGQYRSCRRCLNANARKNHARRNQCGA
jgi:hypothetical protein